MSRDDGFAVADTDTGLLADPKVLALARRLRHSVMTLAAVGLYEAVLLASWKAGRRLTLDETLPGWVLDPIDELADALVGVGLLDGHRRIPEHAWEGWFGPARDRRAHKRELGSRGGLATAAKARAISAAPDARTGAVATGAARPPAPSSRPNRPEVQLSDDAPHARAMESFKDLMSRAGLKPETLKPSPVPRRGTADPRPPEAPSENSKPE